MLDKIHAHAIAKKLKAKILNKKKHDLAVIYYDEKRIMNFGIRRGSRDSQGHDHLPNNLHLSPHDTLELARCPLSYDDWIEKMKDKGLIED